MHEDPSSFNFIGSVSLEVDHCNCSYVYYVYVNLTYGRSQFLVTQYPEVISTECNVGSPGGGQ